MKTSGGSRFGPFVASWLGLLVLAALLLWASCGHAEPRPPSPPLPWSAPTFQHGSFDELLWPTDTAKWDASDLCEGWSGLALRRETTWAEPVLVSALRPVGQGDVGAVGAVVFWFSPTTWSSPAFGGEGPGADAHLLQWVQTDGQAVAVRWTLTVAVDGVTYLSRPMAGGGVAVVLKADIAWEAGRWYCVAICPEAERTRLFVNGEWLAEGCTGAN